MSKLSKLSVLEWLGVTWPFGLMFVTGLGFSVYRATWPFSKFFDLFAEPLLVAGFVGIAVELVTLQRLIEHVGGDLASKLNAAHLPVKLRQHAQQIVRSDRVQEEHEKSYRLIERADDGIDVVVTLSYRIKNFGATPVAYAPALAEESFHQPIFQHLEYSIVDGEGHAFDESNLQQFVHPTSPRFE